jgi:hypothetical protein
MKCLYKAHIGSGFWHPPCLYASVKRKDMTLMRGLPKLGARTWLFAGKDSYKAARFSAKDTGEAGNAVVKFLF